eukprot:1276771-Pleurochrysis_carterae.AAC.1
MRLRASWRASPCRHSAARPRRWGRAPPPPPPWQASRRAPSCPPAPPRTPKHAKHTSPSHTHLQRPLSHARSWPRGRRRAQHCSDAFSLHAARAIVSVRACVGSHARALAHARAWLRACDALRNVRVRSLVCVKDSSTESEKAIAAFIARQSDKQGHEQAEEGLVRWHALQCFRCRRLACGGWHGESRGKREQRH